MMEEDLIDSRSRRMRTCAAIAAAIACVACSHRTPIQPPTAHVTVYFCHAGSDALVAMPFSVGNGLDGARLESALVDQLLAGPAVAQSTVIMFPAGTRASVSLSGSTATVDLRGAIAGKFRGGASDEVGLFKALTYTVTSVAGVQSVVVLVDGRSVATLPGGEFEIDEPLTRQTFSQ
jgi:spore germination protein GerM